MIKLLITVKYFIVIIWFITPVPESRSSPGAVQVRESVLVPTGVAIKSLTSFGGKMSWAGTSTT